MTPDQYESTKHRRDQPAPTRRRTRRRRTDSGTTFVELLVSIVLIGTGVIGTLTALRATIIGTRIENEQSKARLWLQSASGVIERENFADCNDVNSSGAVIQEAYKAAIANGASAPSGFDGRTIEVSVPRVWNGKEFVAFDSQTECYDDVLLRQQLLTITILDDANNVVQSVELIKRDRP